jgi:putative radical SAM enzyme (TIGR03279 family)
MHTQVVVIPGFNDGEALSRTIDDLASLHPAVESLAVVPVGLTRHRGDLPAIESVSKAYAHRAVHEYRALGKRFRGRLGCEFLYVADEFFVLAGLPFPRASYYDGYPQLENGVGLARLLLDHFQAGRRRLPDSLDAPLRLYWVTGTSAAPFLRSRVIESLAAISGLELELVVAVNRYYGESVTVSGLLTGKDMLHALKQSRAEGGVVLLPPNCLNSDLLTLDDLSTLELAEAAGMPVLATQYEFLPLLRSLLLAPAHAAQGMARA